MEILNQVKLKSFNPDSLIIVGMGGSGIVGNLAKLLLDEINFPLPVEVQKYPIYKATFSSPLNIFISFSGNTRETITSFLKAKSLAVVITTGGKLKKIALKQKTPLVIIPKDNLVPRQAVPLMLKTLIQTLKLNKQLKKYLKSVKISAKSSSPSESVIRKIAQKIDTKKVLIYSSFKNSALVYLFKIHLNETSKKAAFCNFFPELTHNEIVALNQDNFREFIVLLIEDKSDHQIVKKQIKFVKKLFNRQKIKYITLPIRGRGLNRILFSCNLAEKLSLKLAELQKINPWETKIIDEMKKEIY